MSHPATSLDPLHGPGEARHSRALHRGHPHRGLLILALLFPGTVRAEGGPHLLLHRGPAPPLLELVLDEELPGARVESGDPHALRVQVENSDGAPGWTLQLRRPGGRLLLSRAIDPSGGEEAAARVIVFLVARTLGRLGPRDDVAPEALAQLDPPPLPGQSGLPTVLGPRRRTAIAVLFTLPFWRHPTRSRPGILLEAGVGGDRYRLSLHAAVSGPIRISTSTLEARMSDLKLAARLEASLLRSVRGELGLGAAAGIDLAWTRARARFPLAPGSPGREAHFFSPLPWGQATVNLAVDPGDPRVELLARVGVEIRPLARTLLLPEGYGDANAAIREGVIMPVLELGLRAVF